MALLNELLEWSNTLPHWQRVALSLIVTKATMAEQDIVDLVGLCKRPFGLEEANADAAAQHRPLVVTDIPADVGTEAVAIVSVHHVSNVNALAPGQQVSFGQTGLTIIYGDNGAGKSGYSRILKRACRARGAGEPVLGNQLSEAPGGPPSAEITYLRAGNQNTHGWKDGETGPPDLGAVSVFDASAAAVYVAGKTDVAYRPFGLDVLDRLAVTCAAVRERMEREKAQLERLAVPLPVIPADTEAGKLLAGLTALTPTKRVEELAALTPDETADLARLEAVLAAARLHDPTKRASELRQAANRLRGLKKHLDNVESLFGSAGVEAISALRAEFDTANQSAAAARTTIDRFAHLPHIDGLEWRRMWEAAAQYAARVGIKTFPNVDAGASCVLCCQQLDPAARERLAAFAAFVQDALQRAVDTARAKLDDILKQVRDHDVRPAHVVAAVEETRLRDGELADRMLEYIRAAEACRERCLAAGGTGQGARQEIPTPPIPDLDALCAGLEREASETAQAAQPGKRKEAESRVGELRARTILASAKAAVVQEIERRAKLNAYDACLRETTTNAITKKSTELTKKYVSETLAAAFVAEAKRLGFTQHELVLAPVGGQRGALYHQIQFKHATKAELAKVVSEGEARCLALAAFLAELRTSGGQSGIVFDDPVSSLDHRWRGQVARRLVDEAADRQVIVFTHEIVFLCELLDYADAKSVAVECRQLRREWQDSGHVSSDVPWTAMTVKKRLGVLKTEQVAAERTHKAGDRRVYETAAKEVYARLRQTWERAVEEVLFEGAVERFRPSIETQRLRRLTDITVQDCDAIEAGMSKCSKWEGGHGHAKPVNEPVPDPTALLNDIQELEQWARGIASRRERKSVQPAAALAGPKNT